MKIRDLLNQFASALIDRRDQAGSPALDLDRPVQISDGRLMATVGTLHLYAFDLPPELPADALPVDVPVTVVPPADSEPTEGYVLDRTGHILLVQTFDAIGQTVASATLVPDTAAFFDASAKRLHDMSTKSEAYTLGPAERLLPWVAPEGAHDQSARDAIALSVLSTIWSDDRGDRRAKLAAQAVTLVRANKRLLVISPDHRSADGLLGIVARALRASGLTVKSVLSRYEMALQAETEGVPLQELDFEAQMHQFYARSRADKATLRQKYDRFRELTPLLAYKAEKQRDLDEVKLLEWRLVTHCTELQDKIKEIDATVAEYESIPIWKRLAMQTVGKNVPSLGEYRAIYEQQMRTLKSELDIAKERIDALVPEAAIPKELRPEYYELKEEVVRLGGTKKIRELLAAEEGTNRQAFIQNKRIVVTTAARVATDSLFGRVRFDVLLADEAPWIPAPFLLAAAGLVREKIILAGDTRDILPAAAWLKSWTRGPAVQRESKVG